MSKEEKLEEAKSKLEMLMNNANQIKQQINNLNTRLNETSVKILKMQGYIEGLEASD